MQFTTKPFLSEEIIKQRIQALVYAILSSDPAFLEGITLVAATQSSIQFATLFANAFQERSVPCMVLDGDVDATPQWLLDNATVWLNACLILQDVSSTGEHVRSLQELCRVHLDIPVRAALMLSKHHEDSTEWQPDWTGFCIPNEYVVGCGMEVNGQLGLSNSIKVLA